MAKQLNHDILIDIIVRLPVKSILRCRCVSKDWFKLLKDHYFVKKHLSYAVEMNKFSLMMHPLSSFELETYTLAYHSSSSTLSNRVDVNYPSGTTFWGTCNGLICLTTTFENHVVLWNPATKEFKELPARPIESGNEISYFKYGFGFDDKFDDFKVVSFMGLQEKYHSEVHVYTLKSNSWKRLENIPYNLYYPGRLDVSQVSVNGAMHWLSETGSKPVIVSFDFTEDRFDKMPLPSVLAKYGFGKTNLCSLRGSLCLHGSHFCGDGIDVWEMNEYGVTESWVKLFTINQSTICHFFTQLVPLQIVKYDKVLLGYDTDVDFHLDLYDLKHETSVSIKVHNANQHSYAATTFVYVESLVPLNSGTCVWQQEIKDSEDGARTLGRGDSKDDDNSEEEEEREEISEGFPASLKSDDNDLEKVEEEETTKRFPVNPRSVDEDEERSHHKSCEILDSYKRNKLDLETRNLDLEAKKLDLEKRKLDLETMKLILKTRKLDFKIREQENWLMRMDTSKMNALQLKWWQMCANEIAEKHRVSDMGICDVNDDNKEEEDDNDVVDIENRKKKAKMI